MSQETANLVKNFINQTKQHIFLTGKAGTGKTTLLNEIRNTTLKQTAIVAPTGIAALNAGGVTIHSMFQLPFGAFIPDFSTGKLFSEDVKIETKDSLMRHFQLNKKRIELLRNLELLIIDEVSMLRADLLDAIDWMLRSVRRRNVAFGGVQLLFIGDLMQLPPVVKQQEWEHLKNYYENMFFFSAQVLRAHPPLYVELEKIYRQDDQEFIELLNHLRHNQLTPSDVDLLNKHVIPDFLNQKNDGYITLTTHNYKADDINRNELKLLKEKSVTFEAEIKGDFPQSMYPLEIEMELKVGAQVMFIKNDISSDKNFYNGKMGLVSSISPQELYVTFPEENKTIEVERYEWENIRYTVDENTKEIKEDVIGTFVHYPIKLAWAITVHKSQGLTFEKAVIDVTDAFAPGQAYVALSRLRSLKGLVLLSPFSTRNLGSNQSVVSYAENKAGAAVLETVYQEANKLFLLDELEQAFDFHEVVSALRIHNASYLQATKKSEKWKHASWAGVQNQKIEPINEPAIKFQGQLRRIITNPAFSLEQLYERTQAAYDFFFKILDETLYSVLKKMEEVKRVPKIKAYLEELGELDDLLTESIFRLKKSCKLVEVAYLQKPMSKNAVWDAELLQYKIAKMASVKQEFRSEGTMMHFEEVEEETILTVRTKKKKNEPKTEKISSVEQTFQQLQEGKSIDEIAESRMLTQSTIFNHIGRLMKEEKIELNDILSEERITELKEAFEGHEAESVTPIKEKYGDKFSWDELRLYKTSLLR